ncbi:PREDICTED: amino acid permease 1-like isoform X1 [Brassica oleracea var. oleracea]|uniref:amino acid permease 1-like isoform X1 n=1 Tax=Brassica oleracea var. oleracea TaxID=109376 RepID=UPI0006A6B438|nr:PREDICTED: amino acid permease 1-like isoform X1 [Brassica oleracea var. oleracea]
MKSFNTEHEHPAAESGDVFAESNPTKNVDDDGREKRTGTWLTASAHIITAVIGSGVLSLSWAIAQLGWIAGLLILVIFSFITYFTSTMLADCYRAPDPVTGKRNYTYMDVVRSYLGGRKVQLCGVAQYGNLIGITVGYTITASISLVAIGKANCFHDKGHHADCTLSSYPYMAAFGIIQIILSQIPNFHKLSFLSIMAAVMSFTYATIGIGLAMATVAGGKVGKTNISGTVVEVDVTATQKIWRSFQAVGDIAFAYAYATVLIEIQDTLKSSPAENKSMKRASLLGVSTTTFFYILCGCFGYAAFGNKAPGDFLTDFGFYEPFWLIDFANACIAFHLIGAYQVKSKKERLVFSQSICSANEKRSMILQVFAQPIFQFVEKRCNRNWPDNKFITSEYSVNVPFLGKFNISIFRLVWRTAYVVITTVVAMIFPFFNAILGLIGAASFWPLTVYFPVEMNIAQTKVKKYSPRWIGLKVLCWVCLIVSLLAAAGSIAGLISSVKTYKPFRTIHE